MSALFRRRRGESEQPDAEADEALDERAGGEPEDEPDDAASPGLPARPDGPWDAAERPDTEGMIDLGSLLLAGHDGMELRLEVDEASGQVTAATVQLQGSAVQLQAFAAPRREGIWDEIRGEIAATITTRQGGTVDEVPGAFGRELIARIPARAPDGRTVQQAARFTGVDGPRWFLRAVFHGPAVYEPEAGALLESVVREVVVVRGPEAMAPRDLLPLRLPEAVATVGEAPEEDGGRPPLEPFRRGPEITEIR